MHRYATLLLLLALALPTFAQSNYGVISGTVMDAQHLPIAGAAISADEGACAARTVARNVGAVKLLRPQNDRNPGGGNRGF